ncbi:abhydrolase domain containing protein 12 [Grosmannia clavigera kw1407]|uniref:Abhydrolase domain containing protein 12 n=1 Tax=Grosmannia clavigera (strain kw1407 / UAMH 11150) TaxID=655863 RepID=F0XF59_GROCL|nr:abhydrolase domain containing protein 12 [Grosmannia clavigera kw1407]EFX03779.1 abhydrolase domain containing protein 12 [Grosmannia clavigera kw1407]
MKAISVLQSSLYAVAGSLSLYCIFLCALTMPVVQDQVVYLNKVRMTWFQDVNIPEQWGFLHNQVTPFHISSSDGESLHSWHILPLGIYRRHAAELVRESSGVAIADMTIRLSFKLLRDDPDALLVLYFHGAAGTLASGWRPPSYRALSAAAPDRIHVVAIDYRGFGTSSGTPSEAGLQTDAQALVDWAVHVAGISPSRIVVFGQSLGTAVAVSLVQRLAEQEALLFSGLVLVAPFADVAQYVPRLLAYLHTLVRAKWPTSDRIADFVRLCEAMPTSPNDDIRRQRYHITILHAKDDYGIPWTHSQTVYWHAVNASTPLGIGYDDLEREKEQAQTRLGEQGGWTVTRRTGKGMLTQHVLRHGLHDRIMSNVVTVDAAVVKRKQSARDHTQYRIAYADVGKLTVVRSDQQTAQRCCRLLLRETRENTMEIDTDVVSSRGTSGKPHGPRGEYGIADDSSPWSLPGSIDLDDQDGSDDPDDVQRLLGDDARGTALPPTPLTTALTGRLYVSHFLSTWNSRMFEFAAVLFLAAAFPGTLRPVSTYAVARGLSAVVFSEAVGTAIDRGDRLAVVRASIVGQRVAVIASCGLFWLLLRANRSGSASLISSSSPSSYLLIPLVVTACVEKLCAIMNLVAVERDWIVVLTRGDEPGRRLLNARMRRIDLFCKLAGPLAISLVSAVSVTAAIVVTLAVNTVSVLLEYYCIAMLYYRVPDLRRRHAADFAADSAVDNDASSLTTTTSTSSSSQVALAAIQTGLRQLLPFSSLPFYLHHPAVLPSISLAVLYLTVLSFSGQMVTYLLSVGYTASTVGLVRTASTVLELSATWAAPLLVARIGDVRAGIWSLSWQSIWLTAGVAWFLTRGGIGEDYSPAIRSISVSSPLLAATGLALGVAVSRVGLWSFDLCAQNIVQEEVDVDHRGSFSTAEAAFQNLFEVLSYVITMVFPRPDKFHWPVLVSIVAVYTAAALYATFVRQRRGHLFHSPLPPAQRWIDKTFFHSHELGNR